MAEQPAQIIVLNGAPRAGKSSIVAAIQERFEGVWLNLGVDRTMAMIPQRYQPGLGLRPGGERPDLEPLVVALYAALYASIAAHSRLGVAVVADVGHHDSYSAPLGTLRGAARRLAGLPALLVGVRCPLEAIVERRRATGYLADGPDGDVPAPILAWQREVHIPGIYDLEVDTSVQSAEACAEAIRARMAAGPGTAFDRLAHG